MSGLGWKTHLRPVVLPPDDLVLLSEKTQHFFRGDAYVRAANLLDGHRSDDEIHALLEGDGVPPVSARLAIGHLRALGMLHETENAKHANPDQVTFWQSLGQDGGGAVRRVAQARAVIQDLGGSGCQALRSALQAAGVSVDDSPDGSNLLIVVADEFLDPRMEAINHSRLESGNPWLLIKLAGTVPWVGPFLVPGRTGCWACLAQRLRLNRQTEHFVEERLGPAARAPLPMTPSSLALAAELAAMEVVRLLATGTPDGTVLSFDLKTNALQRHRLIRRPQCQACADRWSRPDMERAGHPPPAELAASKKRTANGGRRHSPEATLARLEHHVSPITGPVRALFESNENGYLHVAAAQAFPMYRYDFRVLRDNLLGRSGGKGLDPAQARASALCEALERYSGAWHGQTDGIVTATRLSLGDDAIDPPSLFGFSDQQYRQRDAWNATNDEPHAWVPRVFSDQLSIDWVPLRSLTGGRARLAPAAYCYYGHPDLRHMFCSSDSNGCAAGGTFTEAVAHGLLELVERDAAAIWWYNRLPRPAVDLDRFGLSIVGELRDLYRGVGRDFWALDLTTELGIPVIVAISARMDHPVEDLIYGFGSDFDPGAALSKALLEMNQSLFSVFKSTPGFDTRYRTDRSSARRWFQSATRGNQPYLLPDPRQPPRSREDFRWPAHTDWRDDVLQGVARLQEIGLETFVLDQTQPDIDLHVSRVVVPGLCHFWRRFGHARLYEAPVRMNSLPSPKNEDELNPWFIYF